MTNVILTNLSRKWWFAAGQSGLSGLVTLSLLHAAGLDSPETWAQWVVWFLCFSSIWKCLGLIGWFAVLLIAPSSKLLDPVKR